MEYLVHNSPPLRLLVLVTLFTVCENFNLAHEASTLLKGPDGSMFGFAVAEHVYQGSRQLLIGAPKTNTSQLNKYRIEEAGAVFKCDPNPNNKADYTCSEMPLDDKGNNIGTQDQGYKTIEDKSHQWLGATVASSGANGVIIACAPRYVYFSNTVDRREPVGVCYLSNPKSRYVDTIYPCREILDQTDCKWYKKTCHFSTGHCQAGFSATVDHNGTQLVMGAPGSYYWQGQLYSKDIIRLTASRATEEQRQTFDDNYKGYSVAAGEFNGDSIQDYVVGAPRGKILRGAIYFYTKHLNQVTIAPGTSDSLSLGGEQLGEYFGYSVTAADLNDDGLDDIVVGAPMYTHYPTNGVYEAGRVYVFYQTPQHTFSRARRSVLEGEKFTGGRFGTDVASLGDVNSDDVNDLAVGAPYANEDGTGVVYIYHGSRTNDITRPAQMLQSRGIRTIISAQSFNGQLSSFGFSLSGGFDMDSNGYPDLLVGAYTADRAVLIRTRPVIKIRPTLEVKPSALIDADKKDCDQNGRRVSCFEVRACLRYTGAHVDPNIDVSVEYRLDILKPNNPRIFFHKEASDLTVKTITRNLQRNNPQCVTLQVYVKEATVSDKLTVMEISMKYKVLPRQDTPDSLHGVLNIQPTPYITTTVSVNGMV